MSKWSPYQNLRGSDVRYPPVFFTRRPRTIACIGPRAQGGGQDAGPWPDCLYYENMEGGHGGTSNQEQLAYRIALEYTFFARQLM